jgi:hypothetical protein
MNSSTKFLFTLSSVYVAAATGHAAVIVTTDVQSSTTQTLAHTYVPSTTDLINGLAATNVTGSFTEESTGGTPVLTDGAFPSPLTRGDAGGFQFGAFATGGNTGGTSLTYTLASPSNLTGITVYGGWQDDGRDEQSYSILYATAAAPTTFLPLTTVRFNPAGASGNPQATRVMITDDAGVLAASVSAIRFNFNSTENGYSGYSEIDVFGTPIPEPSTFGLLALTAAGVMALRRRRSA